MGIGRKDFTLSRSLSACCQPIASQYRPDMRAGAPEPESHVCDDVKEEGIEGDIEGGR